MIDSLVVLKKDYFPAPHYSKQMWVDFSKSDPDWDWIPIDKVAIRKIKIDKGLHSIQNEVNEHDVSQMIFNFEPEGWEPILIDENYFLMDGQHRLRLAFRTGIKYIDVIMRKKKDPEATRRINEETRRREKLDKVFRSIIRE